MNSQQFLGVVIVFTTIFNVLGEQKIPDYQEIKNNEDSVFICWEAPENAAEEISYKLYFRSYKAADTSWKLLGTTTDTSFWVSYKKIPGGGSYVFAVSAYYEEFRVQTEKHTSLDPTAFPKTGWYLDWSKETWEKNNVQPIAKKPGKEKYIFCLNGKNMPSLRTKILPTGIHVSFQRNIKSSEKKGLFSRWGG